MYFMQVGSRAEKGAPLVTLQVLEQLESPQHPRAGGSESGFLPWVPPPFLSPRCLRGGGHSETTPQPCLPTESQTY